MRDQVPNIGPQKIRQDVSSSYKLIDSARQRTVLTIGHWTLDIGKRPFLQQIQAH
jgi:hypothetical protein